jgi:hypothetical protein
MPQLNRDTLAFEKMVRYQLLFILKY